jgi:MFS family permease
VSNHPFRPLRHRDVRMLWTAAVVSDIGTWVQLIVVGSLVAADTGSAVKTGMVALATFAPQGLASPIGGLLADRFERRRVFATALVAQATVTTVLALVLGAGVRTPSVLTALILLGSAAGATGAPSYSAMIPDLVPKDELMAMISLGVYSWNSGRVVGPLLGSLLVVWIGPSMTIAFNAATFVLLALTVTMIRREFRPPRTGGTIGERLVGGWQSLRRTPGCWHGVVLLILFNLTVVPFMGLIPIYAHTVFHGGISLTGLMSSAQGIGAITGGITITVLAARLSRSYLLERVVAAVALALGLYAIAPVAGVAVAVLLLLGATSTGLFITCSAIVQRDAEDASRGRVMATMQAFMGTSYGIGILTIGLLGDVFNLRLAFGVGAVGLVVGFVVLTRLSPRWRAAVDGVPVVTEHVLAVPA